MIDERLKKFRKLLEQEEPPPEEPPEKEPPAKERPAEPLPEVELAGILQGAIDILVGMDHDRTSAIMNGVTRALSRLDIAVEKAGGRTTPIGRKIMDVVRQFDGFAVEVSTQLRATVDKFEKPTDFKWVMSLPEFPEKSLEGIIDDLSDLVSEIEGGEVE